MGGRLGTSLLDVYLLSLYLEGFSTYVYTLVHLVFLGLGTELIGHILIIMTCVPTPDLLQ